MSGLAIIDTGSDWLSGEQTEMCRLASEQTGMCRLAGVDTGLSRLANVKTGFSWFTGGVWVADGANDLRFFRICKACSSVNK